MDFRISQKLENRGIKIARVNSILIAHIYQFSLILYGAGGPL